VLTDGEWGTAWQRHFSTGRWHPTRGGGSVDWDTLCTRRNLVLVYNAPPRPERPGHCDRVVGVPHTASDHDACERRRIESLR
jgi:hypothetical protein